MNPILPPAAQSRLILASASPRRRELLAGLGFEFESVISPYEEVNKSGEDPVEAVRRHALGKARAVAAENPGTVVIGADTIVLRDLLLGKPADMDDARRMLQRLSGRDHEVITAVALVRDDSELLDMSRTRVTFRDLTSVEVESYLATDEPWDKAGAYGIQGYAGQFITGISGCYFNVMGLPLELLTRLLADFEKMA
ncbi:MAG: septum formation inhibitor Maf [bacterium]|nr:septum formation inhibitor Maf [bacterium]